jgi:hypothetical protein
MVSKPWIRVRISNSSTIFSSLDPSSVRAAIAAPSAHVTRHRHCPLFARCLHPHRGLPVRLSVGMSMHDPSSVRALLHALVHVPERATLQASSSVVCDLCVCRAHFLCFKPTVLVVLTILLACFWCSVLLGLLWHCSVVIVCSLLLLVLADITIRPIFLFSL